jgi:hypothetical protein
MKVAIKAVGALVLGGVLSGCINFNAAPKPSSDAKASASASSSVKATPVAEASPSPTPSETEDAADNFTVSASTTCAELLTVGTGKGLVQRSLDWVLKDGYSLPRDSTRNYKIVQELNDVSAHAQPEFQPYIAVMVDLMDTMRHDLDRRITKSYDLGDYRAAGLELANMCG